MVSLIVAGLNCGTSVDGIDVAVCEIKTSSTVPSDITVNVLSYAEIPIPPPLRLRILSLCKPGAPTTLEDVCDLNFSIGEVFANAAIQGMSKELLEKVDVIASHGQTLWHVPNGKERNSTLQMGEPAVISKLTGKTVASNFRTAEIAHGRQGAPIAGFLEYGVMADPKLLRVSQNIGGMGNATVVLPTSSSTSTVPGSFFAFDTGPGNVLMDATMRILTSGAKHFDLNGSSAVRGEAGIDYAFVDEFLSHPYFLQPPPKTTGRELFSDDVARQMVDTLKSRGLDDDAIIATVTRITSESIARAYENFVTPLGSNIDEVYVCGGGAYNDALLSHLSRRLGESTKVLRLDDAPFGIRAENKEAIAFAVLGFCALLGMSVEVPGWNESVEPCVMGVLTPGKNYKPLMTDVYGVRSTIGDVLGRIEMIE